MKSIFTMHGLLLIHANHLLVGQSLSLQQQRALEVISKKHGSEQRFLLDPLNKLTANLKSSPQSITEYSKQKSDLSKKKIKSILTATFVPSGYPEKTPSGYLSYILFSFIQDFTTELRSILATQRILEGVGVGRSGATALSATLNFIVRDGCGMIPSLLLTASLSGQFKSDIKKWRLFADIINDVGITLEVAATLVPRQFFLLMICLGNMCKAMCGVAAYSASGSINLHWARGSDISDVQAKVNAQYSVSSVMGLFLAAFFAKSVSSVPQMTLWGLYASLTALHIYANMRCMRILEFDYFNTERLNLSISKFFDHVDKIKGSAENISEVMETPKTMTNKESLFFLPRRKLTHSNIKVGVSFNELIHETDDRAILDELLQSLSLLGYAVVPRKNKILIAFQEGITKEKEAKAYFHARIIDKILEKHPKDGFAEHVDTEAIENLWKAFELYATKAGWDLTKTELSKCGYEITVRHHG